MNFLSVGIGSPSRQLSLALKKSRELNKSRKKVMLLMRRIFRDRRVSRKIALMLEKMHLSPSKYRELAGKIQKLIKDFLRDMHTRLDLSEINMSSLPLGLRRFLVALMVLKAEIANLYRLRREKEIELFRLNNMPTVTIESRNYGNMEVGIKIDRSRFGNNSLLSEEKEMANHKDYTQKPKMSYKNYNSITSKTKNHKKYQTRWSNISEDSQISYDDFNKDRCCQRRVGQN